MPRLVTATFRTARGTKEVVTPVPLTASQLSAREALVKMCTLPLLAGENISARFVVPTVASSVDLVVHLGIDNGGVRRVNEIVAVPGRVAPEIGTAPDPVR